MIVSKPFNEITNAAGYTIMDVFPTFEDYTEFLSSRGLTTDIDTYNALVEAYFGMEWRWNGLNSCKFQFAGMYRQAYLTYTESKKIVDETYESLAPTETRNLVSDSTRNDIIDNRGEQFNSPSEEEETDDPYVSKYRESANKNNGTNESTGNNTDNETTTMTDKLKINALKRIEYSKLITNFTDSFNGVLLQIINRTENNIWQ